MKRITRSCLVALACAGCSGSTINVDPPAADNPVTSGKKGLTPLGKPSAEATFQRDGAAWVASNRSYGVRIESDGGWSFQAMHAPKSKVKLPGQPLALAAAIIERGTAQGHGGSARQGGNAGQVAIDRGVAVERITGKRQGVEQSWTFPTQPLDGRSAAAATGGILAPADLVVRIPVSGHPLFDQGSTGVRFRDPVTKALVRYGVATWIDAKVATTTVFPRVVDGAIVIGVPARLVESSSYPAVLDPIITAETELDNPVVSANAFVDAVAYDPVHQQYMVVWENFGIYAQRVTYAGGNNAPVAVGAEILLQNDPKDGDPNATGSGVFFDGTNYQVVWSGNGNDINGIFAQRIDHNGNLVDGVPFTIDAAGDSVTVGGNSLGMVIAAYEIGGTLFFKQLVNGAPSGAAVNLGPGVTPQIASDGSAFLIVFGSGAFSPFGPASAVPVTSGLVAGAKLSIATTGGYPSVSFGSGSYLVTWADSRLGGNGNDEIFGKFVTNGVPSLEFPVAAPGPGNDLAEPRSAFNGSNFLTTYSENFTPTLIEISPGAVPPAMTGTVGLAGIAFAPVAIASNGAGKSVFAMGTYDNQGFVEAFAGGISDGADGSACLNNGDCDNGHCIANYPANTGKTCCATACTGDNCTIAQCSSGTCTQAPVSNGTCGGFSTCQAVAQGCGAPADVDKDNIPDAWETNNNGAGHHYVDANCNGTWDPDEATFDGSVVGTPDVYVTYDYMGYGLDGWSCNLPTDCTKLGGFHLGESCVSNQCVFSCVTDSDCSAGSGMVCNNTGQCPAGEICTNDTCQRGAWHAGEKCLTNGSVTPGNPNGTACAGPNCVCYHTHDPEAVAPMALSKVVESYAKHGVNLHIIPPLSAQPHSHVVSFRSDAKMDNLCEGASIAGPNTVGIGNYAVSVYDLKPTHVPSTAAGAEILHYGLFAHYVGCDTSSHCTPPAKGGTSDCPSALNPDNTPKNQPVQGMSGLAEIEGNDFVVSLGGLVNDSAYSPAILASGPNGGYSLLGAAFMHELGHNLGLRHDGHVDQPCATNGDCTGGDTCVDISDGEKKVCHEITGGMTGIEQPNDKPNYISIMNYRYETNGIQSSSTLNVAALGAAPTLGSATADATLMRLDYSNQSLTNLVENDLDDKAGLGAVTDPNFPGEQLLFTYKDGLCTSGWQTAPATGSVDWVTDNMTYNAGGQQADVDALVGVGVCDGNPIDPLTAHKDWGNFVYSFQCTSPFADGDAPIEDFPAEPDLPALTGGVRGTTCGDVACPGPVVPPSGNPSCTGDGCASPIPAKIDIRPQAQNNWIIASDGVQSSCTASIAYSGGGGNCKKVCGGRDGDHTCFSNNTSTFHDPTPGQAVVTGVTVDLEGMDCTYGGVLSVYVNGLLVGTTSTQENTCKCGVGHCVDYPQVVYQSNGPLPGWVAGGDNTLTVVTSNGNQICLHEATVTTSYRRTVAVAVYGSPLLDVSQIDAGSLRFAQAPVVGAPAIADLDGDGFADLEASFADTAIVLPPNAATGTVSGNLTTALGGVAPFVGSDVVHLVQSPQVDVACGAAGYSGLDGCWYKSALGATCSATCQGHGGFNVQRSTHTGNLVGKGFFPLKTGGSSWQSVECSSTDNNTDFGANGSLADGSYSNPSCYLSCSCND